MAGTKGDIALAEGILARLEALADPDDKIRAVSKRTAPR